MVWVDQRDPYASVLTEFITPREARRAQEFSQAVSARRYAVSHGLLRSVLAARIGVDPLGLSFSARKTGGGKPELVFPHVVPAVHFNLSHSADLAVVAVANQPVGVDVERRLQRRKLARLRSMLLDPREAAEVDAMQETHRLRGVYDYWTRKEATLKATGEGLLRPVSDVHLLPAHEGCFCAHIDGAAAALCVYDLALRPGYSAALAVPTPGLDLSIARWSEDAVVGTGSTHAADVPAPVEP